MTVAIHGYPKFKFFLPGTNQLAVGAKLFTYEPGTSTKKTSYITEDKGTANTNPIILDANGECTLFLDGKYKLVLAPANDTDPPASPYWTLDNVGDADATATLYGVSNKIPNGSFELDTDSDGTPDEWSWTPGGTNTMTIDTTDHYHGDQCLLVTLSDSNTAVAETSFFEVQSGLEEVFRWAMKASAANVTVTVQLDWYTAAQAFISTSTIYSNNSTNPTSWTDKFGKVTVPANARYAKFKINSSTSGNTVRYDNIRNFTIDHKDVDIVFSGARTYTGTSAFSGAITATGSATFTGVVHLDGIRVEIGSTAPGKIWGSGIGVEVGLRGALYYNSATPYLSSLMNIYNDGAWKFSNTGEGNAIVQNLTSISFQQTTTSGSAGGAATLAEVFRIDGDDYVKNFRPVLVSIDGTDGAPAEAMLIHTGGSGDVFAQFGNVTTGVANNNGFYVGVDQYEQAILWQYYNDNMLIGTNNTLCLKLNNTGFIGVGPTDFNASYLLDAFKASSDVYAHFDSGVSPSATEGLLVGMASGGDAEVWNRSASDLNFRTNDVIRGKVSSGGDWLICSAGSDATPTYDLVIYNSTAGSDVYLQFANDGTGVSSSDGFIIGLDTSEVAWLLNKETSAIAFGTSNTERMRIHGARSQLTIGDTVSQTWNLGSAFLQMDQLFMLSSDDSLNSTYLTQNAYYNSGWKFISGSSLNASQIRLDDDEIYFLSTATGGGTGTSATLTTRMKVTNNGVTVGSGAAEKGNGTLNVQSGLYDNAGRVRSTTLEYTASGTSASIASLGTGTIDFTHGLGTNDVLVEVDISGNSYTDFNAMILTYNDGLNAGTRKILGPGAVNVNLTASVAVPTTGTVRLVISNQGAGAQTFDYKVLIRPRVPT